MKISPLAFVHPEAQLGEGVTVEPFAVIYEDVIVGSGTWIGSHVVLNPGTRIGNNCRLFPGAIIASTPQDQKYAGEYTTVEIGNNVVIREFATVNKGTSYAYKTVVQDNVLLMSYVHIAHDCIIGKNAIIVNSVNIAGHVEIGEFAVIGGMCAIHQFSKIGKHVMIAGGTMVRKDVPPYVTASRDPISYTGINSIGLKRRGFSSEALNEIQEIYRVIYLQGNSISKAISIVESEFKPSEEKDNILNFIKKSERGIMKGYSFIE